MMNLLEDILEELKKLGKRVVNQIKRRYELPPSYPTGGVRGAVRPKKIDKVPYRPEIRTLPTKIEAPDEAPEVVKPMKPSEVWKILPLKHKILSVIAGVVTVIIMIPVFVSVIYPAITKNFPSPPPTLLSPSPAPPTLPPSSAPAPAALPATAPAPAPDLTGTWRSSTPGKGLIMQATYSGGSNFYGSGSDPEDADFVVYYDAEWKVRQSGNTIAGPMTLIWVKDSGRLVKTGGYIRLHSTYVTGTVEGTSIKIPSFCEEGKKLTGTFTTDFITATEHYPAKPEKPEAGGPEIIAKETDCRLRLSLSRVK